MSRKPVPAQSGERSRVELTFDKPQLLAQLFGQYDQNLVALEHRLGIYITARGNRVGLEGSAEQVAMARDVLNDLYKRIQRGEDVGPDRVHQPVERRQHLPQPGVHRGRLFQRVAGGGHSRGVQPPGDRPVLRTGALAE